MEGRDGQDKRKTGPKYVWDPKKLTWVEAVRGEEEGEEVPVEPEISAVESEEEVEAGVPDTEVAVMPVPEGEETGTLAAEAPSIESVAEAGGLAYKGALSRLGAFIVDVAILYIISLILTRVFGIEAALNIAEGAERSTSWSSWVMLSILVGYFMVFWTWRGQTPGKMLFGAKIVKKDGSRIGIGRAFLRFIVFSVYLVVWTLAGMSILVLLIILFVLFLIIGLSRKRRGLHDLSAGTVVVSARSGISQPEFVRTPETSEPETDKQD